MAVNTTIEVVMPQMGDSVTEGTILEWHKAEGDEIAADETLVEVSTDKVDAEVPAPQAGTLVKIHAGEGDTVAVGAVLAEISTNGGGGGAAQATDEEEEASEPEAEDADEAEAEDVDADEAEAEDVDADEAEAEDVDADEAEAEDVDADEAEAEDVDADEAEAEDVDADEPEAEADEADEPEADADEPGDEADEEAEAEVVDADEPPAADADADAETPASSEEAQSDEGDPMPGTESAEQAAEEEADVVDRDEETPDTDAEGEASDAAVEIVMPQMGESVNEGTILEWHKQAGDAVSADETVVEISTDKVDAEVPAPGDGTLTEVLAKVGDTVKVGQVIARMTASDGAAAQPEARAKDEPEAEAEGDGGQEEPSEAESDGTNADGDGAAAGNGDAKASPVARRVAAAHGIDLGQVQGSGPGGRISKADVLHATENGDGAAPAKGKAGKAKEGKPPEAPGAQPLKGGAAMLARYMDESRSIPTATSFRTLTVTVMDGRRRQLKEAGQKVSFTHLIAYAIARAATEEMPVMAHHFQADDDDKPQRVDDAAVNLGIAVDVEKKDGSRTLMVPVIRDAGRLEFDSFLDAFNDLIERARTNSLTADDLSGANLSLTNPGGIGTVASVPRLMVGQGTIVATGAIAYPPGLESVGEALGAEKVMTMTSTYDHRIIQGAESGRFLKVVEEYLQGAHEFYEELFAALEAELGPAPQPPAPAAAPSADGDGRAPAEAPAVSSADQELLAAVQAATSLLKAHRTHGHLAARLDPLGSTPRNDPALDPSQVHLTTEIMARIPASILRMYVPGATLADALPHLRETYCGPIAYEIEHISSHRQRVWLREKIESGEYRRDLTHEEQKALLRRLTEVDAFERFIHKAYLGQKQFSIEGLDMTVPMIDELIQMSARQGGREVLIGMAHRGRLNVLAHNLGRPYETIFAEFEGASTLEAVTTIPQGGTGDVKYHHGAEGCYELGGGEQIKVVLESNPSHLEFVGPVVEGATRAAQTNREGPHASRDTNAAVPIILHGDASFPAQGVVAETFNLQGLAGYKVGGTIHIIQNNQVGFTTFPGEGRSTQWASDLAKGFDVPIIHVNADDVPACIAAVRLAFAYREEFGDDVLIDLIGYRRFGHNEADEPAFTQPEMYVKIKDHPTTRNRYARALVEEGVVSKDHADSDEQEVWAQLTDLHRKLKERIEQAQSVDHTTGQYELDRSPSPEVKTAVSADRLKSLNEELLAVPEGFTVHPKLRKSLDKRRDALGEEGGIDWAHAEALAFASLLTEGTPIRLTGQDTERGTFSQRHMVFHDAKTGHTVSPIQALPGALAPMELHNSPLSEVACLGFEYGYSQEAPESLVLWEAQFGDFVNAGQVIVDQFIVSGLAKWGQTTRLTLLLPHGYEGSGPEHSSARLERFLTLAAEGNVRVANLTTPAQYFHLLRRQARIAKQRPLVIMTPKSLLRLSQATNRIEHLSEGQFFPVLSEPRVDSDKVERLILCSGKVYYDLVGHSGREDNDRVAVGRLELLYPFPEEQVMELIGMYPGLREVVWAQEEPRNMGARAHMMPRLMQVLSDHLGLGYIGRPERASPGEGYPAAHVAEQNRIVATALNLAIPVSMYPKNKPGER